MADFISIHPEEWAGLIDGLYFSSMVSTVLPLFLPVVIFAIGLSLFIWLYRLERDGELTNFLLWLVVSSVLLIAAFKTTKVNVELSPIVLVNPQAIMSFQGVQRDEKKNTFIHRVDASGATAILAIPDKLASLFFNFLDEGFVRKVSKQSKTVPIDYLACTDPRYAAATIQTLVLTEVFDLSANKGQMLDEFQAKVIAFKKCYERGFEGDTTDVLGRDINFNFSWGKFKETLTRTAIYAGGGFLVGSKIPIIGNIGGAILGGATGFFSSGLVSFPKGAKCSVFLDAYKSLAEQFAAACDGEFLPGMLGKNEAEKKEIKQSFTNIVLACVQKPDADKFCSKLKDNTLYALEQAQNLSNIKPTLGQDGITGGIKNHLSKVVSDIKAWWYTTTYMDFPLKVALLAKGQGIVLALITGIFPFVVVLSIIPTGRHFINWPLLLKFATAYFLVKLWIPLLYFIVNLAVHLYSGLSAGG